MARQKDTRHNYLGVSAADTNSFGGKEKGAVAGGEAVLWIKRRPDRQKREKESALPAT